MRGELGPGHLDPNSWLPVTITCLMRVSDLDHLRAQADNALWVLCPRCGATVDVAKQERAGAAFRDMP